MGELEVLYKKLKERDGVGRKRVKSRIMRVKFTRYYFTERKKIDLWNRSAGLLQFGFLRFNVRIRRDFKSKLYDLFLKNAFPLYKAAEHILAEGWQWEHLTVKEYNVVVFYADFCKKVLTVGEGRSLADHDFYVAEEAYLKLAYEYKHIELLKSAFEKVFANRDESAGQGAGEGAGQGAGDRGRKRDVALGKLTGFLSTDGKKSSFLEFALAFNMAENRRYVVFGDLTSPTIGSIIPSLFYYCPLDIFKIIISYYRQLNTEIKALQDRIAKLEWLDRQSTFLGDEEPQDLVKFYNSPKGNWLVDSKNYYSLLFSMVRRLITLLERTLFKEWEVMTDEEKVIRTKIVDHEGLAQMYEDLSGVYVTADGYYRSTFPTAFSLAEFRSGAVHDSILSTKPYHELKDKLDYMLTVLYKIAISFEELSVDSSYSGVSLLRYMIVRPISYRGKSVMDLLTYQIGISLKACRFFLSTELLSELKELPAAVEALDTKQKQRDHIDANRVIEELIGGSDLDQMPNGG